MPRLTTVVSSCHRCRCRLVIAGNQHTALRLQPADTLAATPVGIQHPTKQNQCPAHHGRHGQIQSNPIQSLDWNIFSRNHSSPFVFVLLRCRRSYKSVKLLRFFVLQYSKQPEIQVSASGLRFFLTNTIAGWFAAVLHLGCRYICTVTALYLLQRRDQCESQQSPYSSLSRKRGLLPFRCQSDKIGSPWPRWSASAPNIGPYAWRRYRRRRRRHR